MNIDLIISWTKIKEYKRNLEKNNKSMKHLNRSNKDNKVNRTKMNQGR